MKTLVLAFGLVVLSAVSSMAGPPQHSAYLCHAINGQAPSGQVCN